MGLNIDTSQLHTLAVDLGDAPARIAETAPGVMKRGALETKKRMVALFAGHRMAPAMQFSFEFEAQDADGLDYKIGELDSAGPQWGLAAIYAYGTSNNAPLIDHTAALVGEAEQIEKHIGDAAEDAVL